LNVIAGPELFVQHKLCQRHFDVLLDCPCQLARTKLGAEPGLSQEVDHLRVDIELNLLRFGKLLNKRLYLLFGNPDNVLFSQGREDKQSIESIEKLRREDFPRRFKNSLLCLLIGFASRFRFDDRITDDRLRVSDFWVFAMVTKISSGVSGFLKWTAYAVARVISFSLSG
jgi:hypothetical protein